MTTPPDPASTFAFEPPGMVESSSGNTTHDTNGLKTPSYTPGISPTNDTFAPNAFAFTSFTSGYPPSAFSSGSGSAAGASFSSADLPPTIPRDYSRQAVNNETRRPATAGGALQSRSAWNAGVARETPETIDETTELFTNSFGPVTGELGKAMDTHFLNNRRSSEPHFQPLGSWSDPADVSSQMPSTEVDNLALGSAPPHVNHLTGFSSQAYPYMTSAQRPGAINYSNRPVTSDGIVNHTSLGGSLASASSRTLSNMDGSQNNGLPGSFTNGAPVGMMPYRDQRSMSFSDAGQQPLHSFPGSRNYSMTDKMFDDVKNSSDITFVSLGGPAPKKRPRRRYDEIERLYACGWQGCEKSYGTLNHLNAHVAMQKHGEKRLPIEFKDMRKAWRKKKREQQAAAANAQYMAHTQTWNPRPSYTSSDSDFDRRDSTGSVFGSAEFAQRGSVSYPYSWDSRPSTASSVESTSDGRFGAVSAYASGMINPSPAIRRPSAPTHLSIPIQPVAFNKDALGSTPTTAQNSAHSPYGVRPNSSGAPYGTSHGLPMTSPVTVGGQFAFQR